MQDPDPSMLDPVSTMLRARRTRDAGFTLTELMIVVVIVGLLSALAAPSFTRDRAGREGRDLAHGLARELQKARVEAVSTSLGIRAFVFSDRVELRSWVAGATEGTPPRAPTLADPLLQVVRAPAGVTFTDVMAPGASSGTALAGSTHADVDFSNQGSAQLIGQAVPTGATIRLANAHLPANSPDYDFRIDVTALTAHVSVRTN
jgi:prepilin-type N-terminal cleavage/methylation domain-containing protein